MRASHRAVRPALAAATGLALGLSGLVALAPAAQADVLAPSGGCSAGTCTFDLYAKASPSLPIGDGANATFWSYSLTPGGDAGAVGPTLVVTEGDSVTITVHNDLPALGTITGRTSLAIPQLRNFPQDVAPAANAGASSYTFPANQSGTYLYEAGPTENGPRQVAMGMVGALVVLESGTPGTAYGSPSTAFDDEAVVLLSEVDTGLHAAPSTFDMRLYNPQYRLINGMSYPAIPRIPATSGGQLLLRMVNGGVEDHAMGVLGLRQHVVAVGSQPLAHPYDAVSETIAAGDVLDTVLDIPTTQGALYPLYEPEGRLDNGGKRNTTTGPVLTGGMLTLIDTSLATGGTNPAPATTVSVNPPSQVKAATGITFNATITDNTSVVAAEYVVDGVTSTPGCPTCLPLVPSPAGPSVSFTNVAVDTSALTSGSHTVSVRGQDDTGKWGALASATFTVDDQGPTVSNVKLNGMISSGQEQFATNGSSPVAVYAEATEQGSGGGTVVSGAVDVDGTAVAAPSVTPPGGATSVTLNGTLAPSDLSGLTEGTHVAHVTATDNLGNTGAPAQQTFVIDRTAPTASGVAASPTPNNGQTGTPTDGTSFAVTATVADPVGGGVSSGVVGGEAWVGAQHFPMTVVGGTTLQGTIPLSQLTALPDGNVTVTVQSRDAAGNTSATATGTLRLDRQAPSVALNAPSGTGTVTITGTATDAGAGVTQVTAAEYYFDTDPGKGAGTAIPVTAGTSATISFSVNTSTWTNGPHTVFVRAKDAAGNWTTPSASVVVTVVATGAIFSDGFEGTTIVPPWSQQVLQNGGTLALSTASPLVQTKSLVVGLNKSARAYVTDTSPSAETSYTASFRVQTSTLTTGTRTVDVFTARNAAGSNTIRVQLRTNAGIQQMRILALAGTSTLTSTWVNVPTATNQLVTVTWSSAASATVSLALSGAAPVGVTGNTSTNRIDTVWLGASAGTGNGVSGSLKYDAFTSTR